VSIGCQKLAWKAGHKRQCDRMGQNAKAITLHEKEKKIAEDFGDRKGVGLACGNLGNCYSSMGQYGKAIALYEEEKQIAEEVGDREWVGAACDNLGDCYESMGQFCKAIVLHEEHKKIAEEVGDREGKSCSLCNKVKTKDLFSGKQWAAKAHSRKCKACIFVADQDASGLEAKSQSTAQRGEEEEPEMQAAFQLSSENRSGRSVQALATLAKGRPCMHILIPLCYLNVAGQQRRLQHERREFG
jgi:tetratricopeptide (TPR) repeat protein